MLLQIAGVNVSGSGPFAASFVTDWVPVGGKRFYLEAAYGGAAVGNFTLEYAGGVDPTNMTIVAVGSTVATASNGPSAWDHGTMCAFQFVRLRWTRTSGTMTVVTASIEIN